MDGIKTLNAMTVDVEEHFQVSAFADGIRRCDWPAHESRVVANTERLLDIFDEFGVRATFFVLGWVAEQKPDLVRECSRRGHEIASHGWSHQLIYNQTEAEFRAELRKSRELLRELSGQPVEGHRAASFSIDRRNLWALDVVAETGFRYDSSLFPVRHDRYGMPDAPRGIHRVRTARGNELIEVPPSTVALAGQNLPVAGGGYLRLYPAAVTHLAIRSLNRKSHPAVVYVHPWEVDPGQPRIAAPLGSRLRHYVNLSTTIRKLEELMRRFAFGPMAEVVERADGLVEVTLP